jgi:DNA-3-methyladenine glycosylase II
MFPVMTLQPTPLDAARLAKAVDILCAVEPRFVTVVDRHGLPSLRPMTTGLEGLLLVVTEQFLSLQAAAAIWQRLRKALDPFEPEIILTFSENDLMALGLSRAKARSFRGVAAAVQAGSLDFGALELLDDAAAQRALLSLPGVGPWTANIYLLAALQRPDVWPWGDLALQVAAQDLFGLAARPGRQAMVELAAPFAPWRAVAARLLWSHYRGLKGIGQVA